MAGLTCGKIWFLLERRAEIDALVDEFSKLPLPTVLQKHRKLIDEVVDAFSDPDVKPKEEAVARQKVAEHLKVTQQEIAAADRATERDGN